MIKSMTGFGRGEYSLGSMAITAEIKAVNHRYCEISVKIPRKFSFAEEAIKAVVKKHANRGKIEVSILTVDDSFDAGTIHLNLEAALAYKNALSKLNEEVLGGEGIISLSMLSSNPDVLKTVPEEDDEEEIQNALCCAVENACQSFDKMRENEGEKLMADILSRGQFIEDTVSFIEGFAPSVKKAYFDKLRNRISELLDGSIEIPEDKIMTEAAIYADKIDVTEEITRLKSHCNQLRQIANTKNEPIGKKIDFLVQEMNRESNTIGSKCNDISITEKVLQLKNEIEKIREQIQNIE